MQCFQHASCSIKTFADIDRFNLLRHQTLIGRLITDNRRLIAAFGDEAGQGPEQSPVAPNIGTVHGAGTVPDGCVSDKTGIRKIYQHNSGQFRLGQSIGPTRRFLNLFVVLDISSIGIGM